MIQPWPPDMGGGRVIEEFFFDGITVEPRDSAQPPGHRGRAAVGFEIWAKHSMSARRAWNKRS